MFSFMNAGTNMNKSQLLDAPVRRSSETCAPFKKRKGDMKRPNKGMEAFKDAAKMSLSLLKRYLQVTRYPCNS